MATLTRITGSLFNALAAPVTTGTITLQLQQDMISVDGTKVAPFAVVVDLSTSGGVFDKSIYATVGATPGGLAYLVEYDPSPSDTTKPAYQKDGYWRNYWAVPNTSQTVPLGNFVSATRGEPLANYMPLGGSTTSSDFNDDIILGLTASGSNKRVIANQAAGLSPAVRFNASSGYWDSSDDGATYRRLVTGTGTTNALPYWSAAGILADSIVAQAGSVLTVTDTVKVLTLTSASDLTLSPTATIKIAKDLLPDVGYARSLGSSADKILAIHAGELWIDTLVQQNTAATVGGRILVGPTTTLTSNLAIVDTLAALKHNQPTLGDIAYLEENGSLEFLQIDGWPVLAVDATAEWFEVAGDYSTVFTAGRSFTVRASTGNNGAWVVSTAVFNAGTVRTRITVTGNITNGTADGHLAYLDGGPFVYKIVRNLDGSGANAWSAGDAVFNTGTTGKGFIDLYSTSGLLSGSGPTIVGNLRTGTTYSNVAPRWAIGNLNGLYGYGTDTNGAAFGDPSKSWVKLDDTNGLRLGYNATTKVQIDTSGNASFTDSVSAGSGNNVIVLSAVDATYRLWIGNASAASAPFRVDKAGAVTGTNVSFTAGGVTLDSTGIFINPVVASGGGTFANTNAVRWTTDLTYRTAIWRSDDSSGAFIKDWNFDNAQVFTNTVFARTTITTSLDESGLVSKSIFKQWMTSSHRAETMISSNGANFVGAPNSAYLWIWGGQNVVERQIYLGAGSTAQSTSGGPPSPLDVGLTIFGNGEVDITGTTITLSSGPFERGRTARMGDWQAFTPAWTGSVTNPSIGNGTITGRFSTVGSTCHFVIDVAAGSTTTFGSGLWAFSLPINASANASFILGTALMRPAATDFRLAAATLKTSTTTGLVQSTGVNFVASTDYAWTNGDTIRIHGRYEL